MSDAPSVRLSDEQFVGLMSGTSADGVDAVLLDFAQHRPRLAGTHFEPFPESLRREALALNQPGPDELERSARFGIALAELCARAVGRLLDPRAIGSVAAIGCHGQTVRHRPGAGYTVQLINAAHLAELTGITVVADFRSRDVAAGGQGAPLVPPFHRMWFGSTTEDRVVVNVGGIANVTVLRSAGEVTGWDTGPGNCLLDYWIGRHRGQNYDARGDWSRSGTIAEPLLAQMLADPYFAKLPPKSTGRDDFNPAWLERFDLERYDPADVQATLTELTARTIAEQIALHHADTSRLFVCGGGAHNVDLLERLRRCLRSAQVETTSELGLAPDWVEAAAFAWLARCALRGEPASLPSVTGARGPRVLGAIYPA